MPTASAIPPPTQRQLSSNTPVPPQIPTAITPDLATTSTLTTPDTETSKIISGYVIGGGDTTPEGLFDVPRKFVYNIQIDDDSTINITYTAYPPSPTGQRKGEEISLNFHAGTVLIGDYLKARGTYDQNTNTLTVVDEGDYIETYPDKP